MDNNKKIDVIISDSEQLIPGHLVLKTNTWNDYGYYDFYTVSYVPVNTENNTPINLGDYRIRSSVDSEALDLSNDQFISLGTSITFYVNFYNALKGDGKTLEDLRAFLRELNDLLVLDKDSISIGPVITLKERTLKITKNNSEFPEIDKTLFRENQDDIYYLNELLKEYNHELFDFFNKDLFQKLLNDLNNNEGFFEEFVKRINNADTYIIKPLVEQIILFCSDLGRLSRKLLKKIRPKFKLDQELNEKINKILNSYPEVSTLVDDIRELLKVEEDEIAQLTIGHYTSLGTIHYLIKNKEKDSKPPYIRLTNINQMNDPLEGKVIFSFLGKESTHNTQNYVSCATVAEDSLPMWNLYAENATGVFLIYNKDYLKNIINDSSIHLFHVCYFDSEDIGNTICVPSKKDSGTLAKKVQKKLKDLKEALKKELEEGSNSDDDKDNLFQTIEDISFLFKSIEYSYEKELRFYINSPKEIKLETNESSPFPFLYTYFKKKMVEYDKMILGPKATIPRDYIAPYIGYVSDNRIKVEKSHAHFR